MGIREFLKKNELIFTLNSKLKAFEMKRASHAVSASYRRKCEGLVCPPEALGARVRHHLAQRGLQPTVKEKLRIFWIGTDWNQDSSGFLQALNRFGHVTYFVNPDGKYGVESTGKRPDAAGLHAMESCILRQIEAVEHEHGRVDVLLGQMLARNIPVSALEKVQAKGIITVNISMDDRLPGLWEPVDGKMLGAAGLASGVDLTLTTSPECCVRYEYHGSPALYWPLASDPDLFKPAATRDIDVSFIGNKYGARGRIVTTLQSAGIHVEAYGKGWPNGSATSSESADIFGRSKIVLGIGTIGHSEDMLTLKLRDFDATMAGAMYITHRNPDLLQIFKEGVDIECYATESEAVKKITYYLANPTLCGQVGDRAARKAREFHTWTQRLTQVFCLLGVWDPAVEIEPAAEQVRREA